MNLMLLPDSDWFSEKEIVYESVDEMYKEGLKMSDSFMHYHQSALDSQIEQNETEWLFPESVEDKDYPSVDRRRRL